MRATNSADANLLAYVLGLINKRHLNSGFESDLQAENYQERHYY